MGKIVCASLNTLLLETLAGGLQQRACRYPLSRWRGLLFSSDRRFGPASIRQLGSPVTLPSRHWRELYALAGECLLRCTMTRNRIRPMLSQSGFVEPIAKPKCRIHGLRLGSAL
jgi:hypothetical protein